MSPIDPKDVEIQRAKMEADDVRLSLAGGSFAEYVAVPHSHVFPLPDSVDRLTAPLIQVVTVCWHAGFGPIRSSQSVGAMVSHLAPDVQTHFVTGTSAPAFDGLPPPGRSLGTGAALLVAFLLEYLLLRRFTAPFFNETSEHIDPQLDSMLSETETWLDDVELLRLRVAPPLTLSPARLALIRT